MRPPQRQSCDALLQHQAQQRDAMQKNQNQDPGHGAVGRNLSCQMVLIISVVPSARKQRMDAPGVRSLQTTKKRDSNGSMAALCAKSHKTRRDSTKCQPCLHGQKIVSGQLADWIEMIFTVDKIILNEDLNVDTKKINKTF